MPKRTHPKILELCEKVTGKRPRTVIDHLLEHGSITSEELQIMYNYDHPPMAIRDVRDYGIPIETFKAVHTETGRKIAAYRFGNPDEIIRGRIGGRKAFSRTFKATLIDVYGAKDAFTGEKCDAQYLQIDHRVPYQVAGETVFDEGKPENYMLLDASSQRTKSWSCEQCHNWQDVRDINVCKSCFWAFPKCYTHIAGKDARRVEIEWLGEEIAVYEDLCIRAKYESSPISSYIKQLLRKVVEK